MSLEPQSSAAIRVAIIEDDTATREGLALRVSQTKELVLTDTYPTAEDALARIGKNLPDVVLMDINLPGLNGIECVGALKVTHPGVQVLMLTTYDDSEQIFAALRAGASGYLLKRASRDGLIAAIKEVHGGGAPMSMQIARKVVLHFQQITKPAGELEELTAREQTILSLLAKGSFYKEIATELGISPHTVSNHLRKIYSKLHVQSRTEAVLKYLGR